MGKKKRKIAQNPFPLWDQVHFIPQIQINTGLTQEMKFNGTIMEGFFVGDNSDDGSLKDERPGLSTLLEVGSPLEVSKGSVYYWELNESLEFAHWKLAKKKKNTKNIKMNQTTKLSISQWNAWSIQNDTKAQFIQSFPSDIIVIQETWKQV